jgi:hypothetical protein
MSALQKAQIIAQILGSMALFITLVINYRQLRTMAEQVAAVRRSTNAQQILSLLSFIESDEVRAALTVVHTTLHRKHFSDWTESELQAASKTCISFATVGAIVRSGLVPVEPLLEGWEPSLRRCYQVLEPFLREMQKPENGGSQYCIGFDWLYRQLDEHNAGKAAKAVRRNTQYLRRDSRGPILK